MDINGLAMIQESSLVCSADSPAETLQPKVTQKVVNHPRKPVRPIPNTDHIRLPEWQSRTELTAFVRRYHERGFDLRNLELCGRSASSMAKGLKRAIAFQQALIRAEGWPTAG